MNLRIPALRFGPAFHSENRHPITDLGTNEPLGSMGLALGTHIYIDCIRDGKLRRALQLLQAIPIEKRIEMCVKAADHFEGSTLDGGGVKQTPADYLELLCRTSGLSHVLGRENTRRICAALRNTKAIVRGLSGGLPFGTFDTGLGRQGGAPVRLIPRVDGLGCLMPNNSPGVHVTWIAAVAFGIPVVIRPGSAEPFTPYRLVQAFIAAGFPKEAFGFYPCDHRDASRIPEVTKGAIVFGADSTVNQYQGNPLIELHGSGFSKVFIGEDRIKDWPDLIDELALNVAANSGRSCFNASTIVVPKYAGKIADALGERLAILVPRAQNDPEARLSAMAMPERAVWASEFIDEQLKKGKARDVSARYRTGDRMVKFERRTYLQPTIVHCEPGHVLARQEFLFPYAAVVQLPMSKAFDWMGQTLSLAVYTHDQALMEKARKCGIHLVSINKATVHLDRRQPHEGNLFQLLYKRLSLVQ